MNSNTLRERLPRANLLVAWTVSGAMVVLIAHYFSGASSQFFGVADTQEQTIRFAALVDAIMD